MWNVLRRVAREPSDRWSQQLRLFLLRIPERRQRHPDNPGDENRERLLTKLQKGAGSGFKQAVKRLQTGERREEQLHRCSGLMVSRTEPCFQNQELLTWPVWSSEPGLGRQTRVRTDPARGSEEAAAAVTRDGGLRSDRVALLVNLRGKAGCKQAVNRI